VDPRLPASPSLEQLRRRSKDLLRELRAGEPAAQERLATHHPQPREIPVLADAQLVVAREHGFRSWAQLRAYVDRVAAHGPGLQHAYRADIDYHRERAGGLLASARDANPEAAAAFERWSAPLTQAGARSVVAHEHGFPGWAAFARYVASVGASGEPFARAYDAVEARDAGRLADLLDRWPELVELRGTNGNDLLGMASATCDTALVKLLLERGADPARGNTHGWTPLHQAAYSGIVDMAELLLDAGAPTDVSARGDGGTPLVVALFWGHPVPPALVERVGLHPGNLRVAAGLGLTDMIHQLVAPDGTLHPDAGAHRAFYRPHGGFPLWKPSDDPQEVLDEALSWAARSNRAEAVRTLVERGAGLEADVYRGTPLMWAAAFGRTDAVRALLEAGADPSGVSTFGGPTHGEGVTPLHLAAQGGHVEAIGLLLEAGADTTLRDRLYDGLPENWAEHGGQEAAHKLLAGWGN
jgi:ankyrin repeat protein